MTCANPYRPAEPRKNVKELIEEMREELLQEKSEKNLKTFAKPKGKPKRPSRAIPNVQKKPKKRLLVYKGKRKARK